MSLGNRRNFTDGISCRQGAGRALFLQLLEIFCLFLQNRRFFFIDAGI
jgi:hypothetical protein